MIVYIWTKHSALCYVNNILQLSIAVSIQLVSFYEKTTPDCYLLALQLDYLITARLTLGKFIVRRLVGNFVLVCIGLYTKQKNIDATKSYVYCHTQPLYAATRTRTNS